MHAAKALAASLALAFLAVPSEGAASRTNPWDLWNAYCSSFIDGQGRVIDRQSGDRTTSEGEAYAMFFALVANDRGRFDRLLAWTRDNLAQGDLTAHDPGWEWGKAPDGQWKPLDENSAADADVWMSYTLTEAGRLWQEPGYTSLGQVMAERIARNEVASLPGFGPMLLPGRAGFHPAADVWVLNPGYVPLPLVERLASTDPGGPWIAIARKLPAFLRESAPRGFAMDWVRYSPATGFEPAAAPGAENKASEAVGGFDAIRVYLWAGLSCQEDPESRPVLEAVSGMGSWLDGHLFPPEKILKDGTPDGEAGPVGFSAAAIPYLSALGETAPLAKQEQRLQAVLDPATKLYGHPPAYYDQNLVMFGEGWQSQRFRFGRNGELRVAWAK